MRNAPPQGRVFGVSYLHIGFRVKHFFFRYSVVRADPAGCPFFGRRRRLLASEGCYTCWNPSFNGAV